MRAIGALTGLSPGTVRKYWRRLDAMAEKVFSTMDAAGAFKVGGMESSSRSPRAG